MILKLVAVATAGALAYAPAALAQNVQGRDVAGNPCTAGTEVSCSAGEPTGASYSVATPLTLGVAAYPVAVNGLDYTASRGVAADCTGAGTVTLTLVGGGTLSWTVAPGHQNQPYAITGVASSTASCGYWGLN